MHPTRHNRSPLADGTREVTAKDRIVAREVARLSKQPAQRRTTTTPKGRTRS